MKPIKKKTAKFFIILIAIVAVIGTLFTFVPMHFGNYFFTSMAGTISVSSDLGAGVYAEYDLKGDFSNNEINRSLVTIRDVLSDNGYPGANIFAIGKEKIRIEIGYPKQGESLANSNALLSAIGVGIFELRSSSSEEDTFVNGRDHLKGVDINTYNDSIYVVLKFNSEGEKAYEQLLAATQTIYVCMGGEVMTSFDASGVTASDSMPLSLPSYEQAEDFAMRVRLGSMEVTLNPDTVTIDTMSNTLTNGKQTANPEDSAFGYSATMVTSIVALVAVVVLGIGYMILRYGVIGLFTLLAMLFNNIIAVIILTAFPFVEISLSSILALGLGEIIMLIQAFMFAARFEEEFNQGKTVSASFESGFKRSFASVLSCGLVLTVIFGIVAVAAGAQMKVFGLITCLFACLSLFSSIIMIPGFMRIFEAFNDGGTKAYRLKRREEQNND